jgi:hypothetical protein
MKTEPCRKTPLCSQSSLSGARHAKLAVDTTALEREIDQLVYQLYDLTAEEIAVVEGSTRAK